MNNCIETTLDLTVLTRSPGQDDWQEFDRGPGNISLPHNMEVMVHISRIDDQVLKTLIEEIGSCEAVVFLNLAENRNITDRGLEYLRPLTRLTMLNLSSCGITNKGLDHLSPLTRLTWLNLSYCNRISDAGLKTIGKLRNLAFLDLQGCVHITRAGVSRLSRGDLKIHWKNG